MGSYQGISSLQGVNSFTGPNSLGGGNDFQAPTDSRNIQASQIQDTGLRSLLQDQFKPANSYSKLQVAPLGQVKSLADQYQTIDQSKLDDPTRQFLQPYLTGKTSSLDPTKSFISRGQLTSAQSAMEAQNAAQKADYERRLAEYNAQRAAQGQAPSAGGATSPGQPQYTPEYQAYLDQRAHALDQVNWGQYVKGGSNPVIMAQMKDKYTKEWEPFLNAGFLPGRDVSGWTYTQDRHSPAKGGASPGSGMWRKGDNYIGYNPKSGYSTSVDTTDDWKSDLASIMTVASIIGGVVLPGLGTSWAGLAGNAASNAGLSLPAAGLSTASLGIPTGAAALIDPIVGKSLSGALGAGISGGDIAKGALMGGLSGGLGGLGSMALSAIPKDLPFGDVIGKVGITAGLGGLNSLLKGGDFASGALPGVITGGLNAAGNVAAQSMGIPVNQGLVNTLGNMGKQLYDSEYKRKLRKSNV